MSTGNKQIDVHLKPHFRVYSRLGCHLCEDMLDELKQFQTELVYTFEVYDIDDDDKLFDQFNALVPIVFLADQEIFRYFFELASLKEALANT